MRQGSNPMATSGATPAGHVAAGTALAKRARGFSGRDDVPSLSQACRRLMAGRCIHEHNHYPVVTSGRSNGDFEGCARPSQPTIGIAAASSLSRMKRSEVAATRRGNPPGRGESRVRDDFSGPNWATPS